MGKPHFIYHFAHRKEAQSFLKEWSFKAMEDGLYFTQEDRCDRTLLISGEGLHKTGLKLTRILALATNPTHVFHLGVCGHLQRPGESFSIGQAVSLRSCLHKSDTLDFKTFTSAGHVEGLPHLDIMTLEQRLLNAKDHDSILPFASLVDREAWASAQVASFYELPFYGIKVISDYADGEFCQSVKDDAALWSDTLFRSYLNWEEDFFQLPLDQSRELDLKDFFPELHITVSQERTLRNLTSALMIKGHDWESLKSAAHYQEILSLSGHAKTKTKQLIQNLQELLNPLEKVIKEKLVAQTQYLEKAGFSVRFDQGYEKDLLHLNITIEGKEDLKRAARALEQYNYEEYCAILRAERGPHV